MYDSCYCSEHRNTNVVWIGLRRWAVVCWSPLLSDVSPLLHHPMAIVIIPVLKYSSPKVYFRFPLLPLSYYRTRW